MLEVVTGIGMGLVSGVITAALGYAKSAGENFNYKKLLQTVIIGGFIGGVAGAMGISYTQAEQWLGTIGAITLVEYIMKGMLRRLHIIE